MVVINNQKFACESCIKGHRSSSCQHTERPLFEIKKKGRPVSQCEKCRELRKTKRMHNKCTCIPGSCAAGPSKSGNNEDSASAKSSSPAKSRRFKPIAPALPNGIRDVLELQDTSRIDSASKAKVNFVSDSCCHTGATECRCRTPNGALGNVSADASHSVSGGGLATLAQAAAFYSLGLGQCSENARAQSAAANSAPTTVSQDSTEQRAKRRTQPLEYNTERLHAHLQLPQYKRHKSDQLLLDSPVASSSFGITGLSLPPIGLAKPGSASDEASRPHFPSITPNDASTPAVGSDCSCGPQCGCPGCVQHRGAQHASKDFSDCNDGCGTCVDHEGGIELPAQSATSPSISTPGAPHRRNYLEAFYARAASIPPPPRSRTTTLDATNITVYPPTLFIGAAKDREERGAAFGLVRLPPLECGCAGGCGCPEGRCECGDKCGGCCDEDTQQDSTHRSRTWDMRAMSSSVMGEKV
ncbi:hypothetical protein WOLCODRAFT_134864 [Wolfiporia cocos MD-104 SS10]|uniref:Copper-fist domain-containing protein n=1 Tax=Wolfiporia cocos (strain MD-104) TaxID=742152 RepID=A0A2H3ISR9_WOLCO|nr:hypothetical protein WOLCODRAFT_134864 [Wolfiporia cocos MD-104 SS10]